MRLTANVQPVDNYDAGVAAVVQRRTDVLFGERAQLLQAVQRSAEAKDLRVLSRHFTFARSGARARRATKTTSASRSIARCRESCTDPQFGEVYAASFGAPDGGTVAYFRSIVLPK